MQRKTLLLTTLVLAMVLAAGCATLSPQATPPPPTKTPKPTFTSTPDWSPTPEIFPTATPLPATATPEAPPATATPEPTQPPPTPTENPVARLTANQTVNVRQGPGTNYAVIGKIEAGQSYEITGKNSAGSWWQFSLNGKPGWVTANLVEVSGDSGTVQVAQNIPAPPAPPTARPAPTSPPQPTATPQPQFPFMLLKGVERCDPNPGQSYVNGWVRFRSNAPRNGVCVHIAFYGPRVTKCSGCDGVGDGQWGFSPFGGPAPKGTTVEVYVVQCPSNIPPGGVTVNTPGGFGDLTPQSDKWVHTFNESEQCTGVTFVGN